MIKANQIEDKNGNVIDTPVMTGNNFDEKLANLMVWRSENLRDGTSMTLKQIGDAVGTSREYIRQVEAKALIKCRQPHNTKQLER
jgi:DNA-directed RNA polymerase sigma subunit (sigma70/sigma32)